MHSVHFFFWILVWFAVFAVWFFHITLILDSKQSIFRKIFLYNQVKTIRFEMPQNCIIEYNTLELLLKVSIQCYSNEEPNKKITSKKLICKSRKSMLLHSNLNDLSLKKQVEQKIKCTKRKLNPPPLGKNIVEKIPSNNEQIIVQVCSFHLNQLMPILADFGGNWCLLQRMEEKLGGKNCICIQISPNTNISIEKLLMKIGRLIGAVGWRANATH